MKLYVIGACVMASCLTPLHASEQAHPPHWSYSGATGPAHWGELDPAFTACKQGHAQSPVNLHDTHHLDLPRLDLRYHASAASITNNGHTVQFDLADGGEIQLPTGTYRLVGVHFHTPGEERFDGKTYPMGAHLVHRNADGQLAVVAVLFRTGKTNKALAPVFAAMSAPEVPATATARPLDATDFLPADRSYYAFTGSLTTPPCSEGVQWRVMRQPVTISPAQLATFRKLYPMNARPSQPLNARVVGEGQ